MHPNPNKCAIQRGFFVLRDCGKPTEQQCPVCQRAVCKEHQRTYNGRMLCIECAVRERRAHDWPDDHDPTTIGPSLSTYYYAFGSDSSPSNDEAFSGGGGTFGGGGAGGSWAAADGVYAYRDQFYEDTTHDPAHFTPTDFAAFDAAEGDAFDDDLGADFFDS